MKFSNILFFLLFSFSSTQVFGQYTQKQIDSLLQRQFPDQEIEEVVVIYRDPKSKAKLQRDVLKAYPYALRAASIINQIEENTASIHGKRKKKRYLKKKEEQLKDAFESNLRQLTKTQGRYMVRMIERETGITVYDLLKEYKGGVNATFWQLIAKKYDSDLKSIYEGDNSESIDYEIEMILEGISPIYKQRIMNEVKIDPPTYRDFQPN